MAGMSVVWAQAAPDALTAGRVLLVFAGVIAAGAAVAIRPASEKVLLGAAATAFIAHWGLYVGPGRAVEWDSVRLVLAAAAVVAFVAFLIVLLPRLWRRVVVSLIVVVHFGGILSAVLSAPPGPWISNVAYVYFYKPYLEFMYLTNAYHFYAPNPGPAYIFWFRIEYKQDKRVHSRWLKIPDVSDDGWPQYPLAIQYQRRLALASLSKDGLQVDPRSQDFIVANLTRVSANGRRYIKQLPLFPLNPYTDYQAPQYLPPTKDSQIFMESYVRHVAHEFQEEHPKAVITGIKVYRVEHRLLLAGEFAEGLDPQDPVTYYPYYWGDYDAKGDLKSSKDPYLYWHLPFVKVLPSKANELIRPQLRGFLPGDFDQEYQAILKQAIEIGDADPVVLSYVWLHAGDDKWVRYPDSPDNKKWVKPRP
jgi:hypothetical protein